MPIKTRREAANNAPPQHSKLLRTSERSLWKTCRWAWYWCYNDHLKPIEEKPALRFGSLVHAALEARYPPGIKRGPKPAETFEKLYEASLSDAEKAYGSQMRTDEDWEDAGELGVDMLEHFVEVYGRDEEWKVIQSEMTFKVPVYGKENDAGLWVPCAPEDGKHLFDYVGTMDGVWENRMDQGVRIIDWKTTGHDPIKEAAGKSVLDEQSTAYWTWGCDFLITEKVLKPRQIQALDGMLFGFLRKAKRDERPQNSDGHYLNKDGSVSKNQPPAYFHRELVYRSEIEREHARQRAIFEKAEMNLALKGVMPIYKNPQTGTMGHCNWCGYRDICELHEAGADWETMRDATMTTWDPYDAHEIEEEGKAR